jgi:tetratricopeptide (TPR) repeat protein
MKCDRCGIEGEIEAAFFKTRRSGSTRNYHLCPPCWRKKRENSYWASLSITMGIGLLGAGLAAAGIPDGWLFLNLFLLQIFIIVGTIPHEFGHAFAARLLGLRLFQVSMGFGKTLYERRVGNFFIVVKATPYGGRTIASPRSPSWFRSKYLLFIAAGPLANLLLAASVWPWVRFDGGDPFRGRLHPLNIFFIANLVIVAANLLPFRSRSQFGTIGSDGLQLAATPFLTRKKIAQRLARCCTLDGLTARRSGDHQAARQWFEKAAEMAPDDLSATTNVAVNLLDLGRLEEARAGFLRILESSPLPPPLKALAQNNLAYTDVRMRQADLLQEADRNSREALAAFPTVPALKGTRGAVLCAMERFDEGIPLLQQAMTEHEESGPKALNACDLAVAERKRGNIERSEALWKSARELDPLCPLLEQAGGNG